MVKLLMLLVAVSSLSLIGCANMGGRHSAEVNSYLSSGGLPVVKQSDKKHS